MLSSILYPGKFDLKILASWVHSAAQFDAHIDFELTLIEVQYDVKRGPWEQFDFPWGRTIDVFHFFLIFF